jgi:hypothetical protein
MCQAHAGAHFSTDDEDDDATAPDQAAPPRRPASPDQAPRLEQHRRRQLARLKAAAAKAGVALDERWSVEARMRKNGTTAGARLHLSFHPPLPGEQDTVVGLRPPELARQLADLQGASVL